MCFSSSGKLQIIEFDYFEKSMPSFPAVNKKSKLIVEASNIHLGGGFILLSSFIEHLVKADQAGLVFLDARLKGVVNSSKNLEVRFVKGSIIGRFLHWVNLKNIPRENDTLFCFGNIPPFSKMQNVTTIVFLQNWFLICHPGKLKVHAKGVLFRLLVERFLLRFFIKNSDLLLVQTNSMARLAKERLRFSQILVYAFTSIPTVKKTDSEDFYFYPVRGDDSKNHRNLIKAWIELSKASIFPRLVITVDSNANPKLCKWIDEQIFLFNLNVENVGFVNADKISDIYATSPTIIYPSFFESFGLPLVEANALGLEILASELDYVRDVCSPMETFDPHSPHSICNAVLRHRNLTQNHSCGSASDVFNMIMNRENYDEKQR